VSIALSRHLAPRLDPRKRAVEEISMINLDTRAERVRQITEGNHGKVLGREGDVMTIEVPADVAIGLNAVWGMGKFSTQFLGCETRLAPRRVFDADHHTVVCHGDMVTTSFYKFHVYLTASPAQNTSAAPTPAEIRVTDPVQTYARDRRRQD
jgi:hypothetical protein